MMSKSIDRIGAENDIRAARVGMMVQSGEGFKDLVEDLQKQVGAIVTFDEGKKAMAEAVRDNISEGLKSELNGLGDLGVTSVRRK